MGPRTGLDGVYIEKYQHGNSEVENIVRIIFSEMNKSEKRKRKLLWRL
jgi:hypothetical protein